MTLWSFLTGALAVLGAVFFVGSLLPYLVWHFGISLLARTQNLQKKYDAKWAVVTGASSGTPPRAPLGEASLSVRPTRAKQDASAIGNSPNVNVRVEGACLRPGRRRSHSGLAYSTTQQHRDPVAGRTRQSSCSPQ